MEVIAKRNITITKRTSFLAWVTFLVPIIEIFYAHTWLSLFQIILISNVFTLVTWIFEIPTSVFADTMGRRKSLMLSVFFNLLWAVFILFFPHLRWFIIASFCSALYFCFWSWTEQAFIDENLKILWNQKWFGKVFGNNLFLQQVAWFVTPVIASLLLKRLGGTWYTVLAGLDVCFAIILVFLQYRIVEVANIKHHVGKIWSMIKMNIMVAKTAIQNIRKNTNLKTIIIYRALSSNVSFLTIILLPTLSNKWMPDRYSWFIVMAGTIAFMLSSKFIYKLGEKYSYNFTWILWTTLQGIVLVIVGFVFKSWIIIRIVYILMELFEWFRQTSWNHVLVEESWWVAVATTRSIVFSIFALYATILKLMVSFLDPQYALIIIGTIILLVNIFLWKKIILLKRTKVVNN